MMANSVTAARQSLVLVVEVQILIRQFERKEKE